MKSIKITPLKSPVHAEITIPGSKSYTNRALLMAALTEKPVKIINPLFSDDTKALIDCLNKLGIETKVEKEAITVVGSYQDVTEGNYELNTNLAATAIRFLLPLLCILPGTKTLKGEQGLNKRPIADLVESLQKLGASIEYMEKNGYPPLRITTSELKGKTIDLNGGISSQFFTSLFIIAPMIGGLTINVKGEQISKPYIDMTIDSMKAFGIQVINNNYTEYIISSDQKYNIDEYVVEGDCSSAAYFFAIAALTKSNLIINNLNPNSVQADKKILKILEDMGSEIKYGENNVAITGRGIKPVNTDMVDFPDQAQTLAVLAAFADGETVLSGLQSLHVKETDRLKAVEIGLNKMNITTKSTYDTLEIFGGDPKSARINTFGDQRTAMSFAVAGSALYGMEINDPDVVNKTFPEFWDKLEEIGIKIERMDN